MEERLEVSFNIKKELKSFFPEWIDKHFIRFAELQLFAEALLLLLKIDHT